MASEPTWLDGARSRTIYLAAEQMIQRGDLGGLPATLDAAYAPLDIQRAALETAQRRELARPDTDLAHAAPSPDAVQQMAASPMPPSAEQLVQLAHLQTAVAQHPNDWHYVVTLAQYYYEQAAYVPALQAINQAHDQGAQGFRYTMLRASILTEYANTMPRAPRRLLVEAEALFAALGSRLTYPDKIHNELQSWQCLHGPGALC